MEIKNRFPDYKPEFGFDCRWKRFVLVLSKNEFACYSLFDCRADNKLWIHLFVDEDAEYIVSEGERNLAGGRVEADAARQEIGPLSLEEKERNVIRIEVVSGRIEIEEIITA